MNNSGTELLKVGHLRKDFGGVQAARDVSFVVSRGSMVSLLGPSGCGKTTILRCIAGLELPTAGIIEIGGVKVSDVQNGIHYPPEKRSIGMVFQSYAVWPHMTVFGNVSFPLKLRKKERDGHIEERVHNVLKLVGLADLEDRPATNLSGGQQQRVALARALVAEPELVLFDEPLSNLDAKLREYMRVELIALQERLKFTAVYVTHDQQEALALSHQLIVMNEGAIEQQGAPLEIYTKPRTNFVADFMGATNLMKGQVVGRRGSNNVTVVLEESGVELTCSIQNERSAATPGISVLVSFRPERTSIMPGNYQESSSQEREEVNKITGRVETVLYLGEFYEYSVRVGKVRVKARSRSVNPIPLGLLVQVSVAPENCLAIPLDG